MRNRLEQVWPGLTRVAYSVSSPADRSYNCVAWAAGDVKRWWWPDPLEVAFWPEPLPRAQTLDAFARAFALFGYVVSETPAYEIGFEKIAVFASNDGTPKHVARQLSNGKWTSKLGRSVDIEHETLDGLQGQTYGDPVLFLKRRRASLLTSFSRMLTGLLQRFSSFRD